MSQNREEEQAPTRGTFPRPPTGPGTCICLQALAASQPVNSALAGVDLTKRQRYSRRFGAPRARSSETHSPDASPRSGAEKGKGRHELL